jgi:hypothetical protein
MRKLLTLILLLLCGSASAEIITIGSGTTEWPCWLATSTSASVPAPRMAVQTSTGTYYIPASTTATGIKWHVGGVSYGLASEIVAPDWRNGTDTAPTDYSTAHYWLRTWARQVPSGVGTYSNLAWGTENYAFAGGVLAPSGKVIFVPRYSNDIGIYDPVANSYSNLAWGTENNAFSGGVLAPSGKVIFVPSYSDAIGIYDPVANSYSNLAWGTENGAFFGGVLAPSGKVIFVPSYSDAIGIYDPKCQPVATETCLSPLINKF